MKYRCVAEGLDSVNDEDDPSSCPGSDVNSMDSVDSGCTMGAGENQSDHTASSSSELVVWEIEVPKVSPHSRREGRNQSGRKRVSRAQNWIIAA